MGRGTTTSKGQKSYCLYREYLQYRLFLTAIVNYSRLWNNVFQSYVVLKRFFFCSVVDIVTRLRAGRSCVRKPVRGIDYSVLQNVYTGSRTSYSVGNGVLSRW